MPNCPCLRYFACIKALGTAFKMDRRRTWGVLPSRWPRSLDGSTLFTSMRPAYRPCCRISNRWVISKKFKNARIWNFYNLLIKPDFTGFIDFIVEPTMMVCSEMLTKMVEPLVCLPSSDSLFPPNMNNDGRDGSVSATSLSPIPPDL